ncbi:MAG: hypothetical protein IT289_12930 [Oligoflexia bacterium]|nr:hypothetical protein [Oligoflexia bacterium]
MSSSFLILTPLLLVPLAFIKNQRARLGLQVLFGMTVVGLSIYYKSPTWIDSAPLLVLLFALVEVVFNNKNLIGVAWIAAALVAGATIMDRSLEALFLIMVADVVVAWTSSQSFGRVFLGLLLSLLPAIIGHLFTAEVPLIYGVGASFFLRIANWPLSSLPLNWNQQTKLFAKWAPFSALGILGCTQPTAWATVEGQGFMLLGLVSLLSGRVDALIGALIPSLGGIDAISWLLALPTLYALLLSGRNQVLALVPAAISFSLIGSVRLGVDGSLEFWFFQALFGLIVGRIAIAAMSQSWDKNQLKWGAPLVVISSGGLLALLNFDSLVPQQFTWSMVAAVSATIMHFSRKRFSSLSKEKPSWKPLLFWSRPSAEVIDDTPRLFIARPRLSLGKLFRVFQADLNLAWALALIASLIIWRLK